MAQIRGTAGYNLGSQDNRFGGPGRADATNDPSPLEQLREQTNKIEEWLDTAADPIKQYIPAAGRFLIVCTFMEDAIRIMTQWSDQLLYLKDYRHIPWGLTHSFLFLNVIAMISCSSLVIIRKYTEYAVFGLIGVVITQALGYGLIFDLNFFLRNLSVMGGLLMVLSDSWVRKKFAPAGLPLPAEKDRKKYIQLAGRILLILLFVGFIWSGDWGIARILVSLFGLVACVMVVVGFKAKWSAILLVVILSVFNLVVNNFWTLHEHHPHKDFAKYDFFQILSIVGGLLLLVNMGPGSFSVDEKKKTSELVEMDVSQYLADSPPTVVPLVIKPHFEALTDEQKLYAHHISKAAFFGTRIILRQVSPESESIYDLIIALQKHCNGDWASLAQDADVGHGELQHVLEYFTQFLGNLGNYKGFGDVKFIPRCSPRTIAALAAKVPVAEKFHEQCKSAIYADGEKPSLMHFGFPGQGHMSTYYPDSPDITREEIEKVGELLGSKGILPENTRIRKTKSGDYEVLVASALSKSPLGGSDAGEITTWELSTPLEGKKVSLVFGDHQEEMAKIALHIKKAGLHAANDTQKKMMDEYAKSFGTGSLKAFKESQKLWVKDKGPEVESNIGFIETYRDPAGIRGEWEGMVAMVNKERTRAFQKLVETAPAAIPKLPWSKDFEKDEFSAPDFTSLEVLSFASSGIPAGINIPNYDDIRQHIGFKNVSLGNVLGAKAPNEPIPFIRPEDLDLYQENRDAAFEVQVGIHELLGHGTGKLLQETSPGVFNFDPKNLPISPVTKQPISTYYKPSETYSTVFGPTASSYEECRAECVAMALSCDFSLLKIFGFGDGSEDIDGKAGDVLYASYLSMARAGVVALEFWDPKSKKWGQIHMQARYSILKTFLDAGDSFCTFEHKNEDLSDLTIHLDRNKILTHGRPAVEAYLQKLHIFKSTADVEEGRKLYENMTSVEGDFWIQKVRGQVLKKKSPRKVFVMVNTVEVAEGKVELKEYESSMEGMMRSWAEREA